MTELLQQDFDGLDPGSYPDEWVKDGSSEQEVTRSEAYSGSQSLQLVGRPGGCWEAIANAPTGRLPPDRTVHISGAVKPGVRGEVGCHEKYGRLNLRTEVGSWSKGDKRSLLLFNLDGTITGHGETVGEFTAGEWIEYNLWYTHRPNEGEVEVRYDLADKPRQSVTAPSMDTESELSHLAFQTGDFTAYWDDITVQELDGEVTETETPSPTRSPQQTQTPGGEPQYDLSEAALQQSVQFGGEDLLVLRGIPGTGAGRFAVTDSGFELVDTDTARDALVTYWWGDRTFLFDWEAELTRARSMRSVYRASELLNRAASFGWEALEAYVMAQINPGAAIPAVIDLLGESVNWAVSEIVDPYMETMSKMSQWTYTYDEIRDQVQAAESLLSLPEVALGFADVGVAVAGTARTWVKALSAARSVYASSGSITTSLSAAGQGAAAAGVAYAALGLVTDTVVDTVTTGMKENAELSAIGHAYTVTRIPIIQRIIELHDRATDYELSPAGVWELSYLTTNHHYMSAVANHGMYRHAHAVETSPVGFVWDGLTGVAEAAEVLEKRAEKYLQGGAGAHSQLGNGLSTVFDWTAASVNHEINGSPTELGGESV